MPDMYHHNYTLVKRAKDDSALTAIIESEIGHRKNDNKDFCLIKCHIPVRESITSKLPYAPEVSALRYYVFDVSGLPNFKSTRECSVLKVDKPEMVDDLLRLELESDEDVLGRDFCTRRVNRRKDEYLADEGVDAYICYTDNEAVGKCDLFILGSVAKIEDFSVSPRHQRKSYGTAILKALIEIAVSKGVTAVYLETDEDDTAKEMYQKIGFSGIYRSTELFFKL